MDGVGIKLLVLVLIAASMIAATTGAILVLRHFVPNDHHSKRPYHHVIARSYGMLYSTSEGDNRAADISVFDHPATPGDSLPVEAQQGLLEAHREIVEAGASPGALEFDRSRAVRGGDAFVVPTSRGWVCYSIKHIVAVCVPDLPHGIAPSLEVVRKREGDHVLMIYGIASDDISGVTAIVDGEQHDIDLDRNFFFFARQIADPATLHELAIKIRRRSGESDVLNLDL